MEVKIPMSGLHLRPQLPYRSSPSLNRRSSSHGGAVVLPCRSRSVEVKRAAIISGNLDSIFDDEFRFNDYNLQPPKWREEIFRANMEQKANRVDIPFSLRIIKRKNQWKQGVREVSESAYCSVKKAFSSMVFIIRELQSFSLQMREKQSYENLQGIINCVQREMHDSFVWLFQQVFSHTPTLMVSLMILLANYSVNSMAMLPSMAPVAAATVVAEHQRQGKFDSSSFSVSSTTTSTTGAKTISVGGSNGSGGGKSRPAARGAPDDSSAAAARNYVQNVFQEETSLDEDLLWNSMVNEASRMEAEWRGEALDDETVRRLVSPVTAAMEEDDYYFETEMMYRAVLATDPNNSMLLANFGQFLYLVARDFDRAEVYLKKSTKVEPLDPESLNKYANFLWHARNDISAAEKTYYAAVSTSPSNSNYTAIYAHFLWSTGGSEETCNPTDQSPQLQ